MADTTWYDPGMVGGFEGEAPQIGAFNPTGSDWGGLASMFNPSTWYGLGYKDSFTDPDPGTLDNPGGGINPALHTWMNDNGYALKGSLPGNNTITAGLFKDGNSTPIMTGGRQMTDPRRDALGVFGVASNAFMPGLTGYLGGGLTGALGAGALKGGVGAALGGGNPVTGAATGAVSAGLGQYDTAGALGVTNPTLGSIINKGVGTAGTSLLNGANAAQAVGSGLVSAAGQGLNKMSDSIFDTIMNTFHGDQETPLSSNPAQNASYPQGWTPQGTSTLDTALGREPAQMSYAPPSSPAGQDAVSQYFGNAQGNTQGGSQRQSSSPLSSLFGEGGLIGNGGGNGPQIHGGDLAQLLYGFYNNRRQQQRMQQTMGGLQGLYDPNGAYATNLKNTLQAQYAAGGRRSDQGGLQTKLMADLAGHNAQMMPYLNQMQGGLDTLQNRNMGMVFQGLQSMFPKQFTIGTNRPQQFQPPTGQYDNPGVDYANG